MTQRDITVFETGAGGDFNLLGYDLEGTSAIFNQVYLSLFGGNPGHPTTGNEIDTEERLDWWGNELLSPNNQDEWFNSELEHALNTTVLNSSGRITLEEAVKTDLSFFNTFAEVSVAVSIISDDKVEIKILLQEKGDSNSEFKFVWDATKQELIQERII